MLKLYENLLSYLNNFLHRIISGMKISVLNYTKIILHENYHENFSFE